MRNAIVGQVPRRPSWSQSTGYSASPLLQDIFRTGSDVLRSFQNPLGSLTAAFSMAGNTTPDGTPRASFVAPPTPTQSGSPLSQSGMMPQNRAPLSSPPVGVPSAQESQLFALNRQLNGLQDLRERIQMAGRGLLQHGRAAFGVDEANRQRAMDMARAQQQILEPAGDSSRAGMFGRLAAGQVMTPDRGLGGIEHLRWGQSPLVFNRQMTDEQAMSKLEQEGKAFTRISDDLGGVRAYTSRRQAAEDRLAALEAAGVSGSLIDDAYTAVRKLREQDAQAMGRYRANQQKFRKINEIPDGMSERDFRKQQRRIQAGRKYMLENKLNPKSPLAQAMFPETLADSAKRSQQAAGGSPLARSTASPITAPSGTPRAAEQATKFATEQAPNFPVAKALGATPDWGTSDLIKGLHEKDMNLEVSDVANLQQMVQAYQERAKSQGTFDEKDPFGIRSFSNFNTENATLLEGLFNNLLSLSDDRSRKQWASDWNSRKSKWHTNPLGSGYRPPAMGTPANR